MQVESKKTTAHKPGIQNKGQAIRIAVKILGEAFPRHSETLLINALSSAMI